MSGSKRALLWSLWLVFFATAFGFGCYFGQDFLRPSRPAALLKIEPADLSFGTVWPERHFRHTVPITNVSRRMVEVIGITSSCNCTKVEPQTFRLSPGESRPLEFELDLSLPTPTGEVSEVAPFAVQFSLRLADEAPFSDAWQLEGSLRRAVRCSPATICYGGNERLVCGSTNAPRTVQILRAPEAADLRVECDPALGTARLEFASPAAEEGTLTFTPAETLAPGPIEGVIRFYCSKIAGDEPIGELSVAATAVLPVIALPGIVSLGPTSGGVERRFFVALQSLTSEPFSVLSVSAEKHSVLGYWPAEAAVQQRVEVVIESTQTGKTSDQIEIEVEDGNRQSYTVNVPLSYYGTSPGLVHNERE